MPRTRLYDNASTGHVYVIDREYRIVHLDQAAQRVFPNGRIGARCYESFRNQSEPCKDCPWQPGASERVTQAAVFSNRLQQWYETTCLELDWFEHGPCVLFSSRPISVGGENLLTALKEPLSYDELFEINLTEQTYKTLCSEPGKFKTLPPEGSFGGTSGKTFEEFVHPDDMQRFLEFWDLETMPERLDKAGGTLQGEFRKSLQSGDWAWTSQNVVSAKRGPDSEIVVMCFVCDIDANVKLREDSLEKAHLVTLRERDQLTGLYNASTLYRKAEELLESTPGIVYEAIYVDIEHFKLYNEWHGHEAGNDMLRAIADHVSDIAGAKGGIAGHLGGDDFVLILPRGLVTQESIEKRLKMPPFDSEDAIGFQPALGICEIDYPRTPVITACDHAMTAMNNAKGSYTKRVSHYRPFMTEALESETKILLEVKRALENREFVPYWQPQCSTRTGRIVGLEALVRWKHPERGIVAPGEFVPVLERNGFVTSLDLYVWEAVCRQLRDWINRGIDPLPVSVNVSRADIHTIDVPEAIEDLTKRYGIDRSLLGIEITEGAYAEDEKITDMVNRLRNLGYVIFMDDFGSGYSSLNMLKDINVDVLKIDMGFLSQERNARRGESILEAIVSMARLVDLRVVAEGAETEQQVAFLQDIGCEYAQGYHFHKPMCTTDLEALLSNEDAIDRHGILDATVPTIDMQALMRDNGVSRTMLNNLIGGMAVYAVYDDHYELLQVNNAYYHVTGCNPAALKERRAVIWKQIHPDDLGMVMSVFDEAERHPVTGAQGVARRYRINGDLMWMKARVFFLSHQEERRLFYASVEDVTNQRTHAMASLGSVTQLGHAFELLGAPAMNHWYINLSRKAFLNEQDRALLNEKLGVRFEDWSMHDVDDVLKSVIRTNHDEEAVRRFLDQNRMLDDFAQGISSRKLEYRQAKLEFSPFYENGESADEDLIDDTAFWAELNYHLIRFDETGDVYVYLYAIDIDQRKRRELKLESQVDHDALTGLPNRQTGMTRIHNLIEKTVERKAVGAFAIIDVDSFKSINNRYGYLCGDTALSHMSRHLRTALCKESLICRWDGDEFVAYCEGVSKEEASERMRALCERTWETEAEPGQVIVLSVCAGVSLVPDHATSFEQAYEKADVALRQAKEAGRGRFFVYDPDQQQARGHDQLP